MHILLYNPLLTPFLVFLYFLLVLLKISVIHEKDYPGSDHYRNESDERTGAKALSCQSRADERTGAKALSCQSRADERTSQEAEAKMGVILALRR